MCVDCAHIANRKTGRLLPESYWRTFVRNAVKRGLSLSITREQVHALLVAQDYRCAISGDPIEFASTEGGHARGATTASIDRIESQKDYEIENVQIVHKHVNFMKRDLSDAEFIAWCKKIAKNN